MMLWSNPRPFCATTWVVAAAAGVLLASGPQLARAETAQQAAISDTAKSDNKPDGAKPSYYFIAAIYWETAEQCQAALSGPAGEAALADLPNFAGAGVDIMTGPAEVVI